MAKFIIQDKIYNTDTAEKLCEFTRDWEETLLGSKVFIRYHTTLYRTIKGAYFCVRSADFSRFVAQLLTEKEGKQYLMRHNYTRYVELYGELEEG